jgi:hypothetical protein
VRPLVSASRGAADARGVGAELAIEDPDCCGGLPPSQALLRTRRSQMTSVPAYCSRQNLIQDRCKRLCVVASHASLRSAASAMGTPFQPPRTAPRALAACSGAFVRWDIISASCSATPCVAAWNPTTLCYVEE